MPFIERIGVMQIGILKNSNSAFGTIIEFCNRTLLVSTVILYSLS
jgi:hypothetical protein